MFIPRMLLSRPRFFWGFALAALLLPVAWPAQASGPPYGIPSGVMPWEYSKYQGYKEAPHAAQPPAAMPPQATQAPVKYTIHTTQLPVKHEHEDPNVAIVMAHLPETAQLWFNDMPTKQKGMVRYFESPSLTPGKTYYYTAHIQWFEDGRWVDQMHKFPIHAGEVHCLDLISNTSEDVDKKVKDSLAKLDGEDRKAAEEQRFCAVQEGIRLGSMGPPVKVMIKGQAVYLCCKGCMEAAEKSPDQTLTKVRALKAKKPGPSLP